MLVIPRHTLRLFFNSLYSLSLSLSLCVCVCVSLGDHLGCHLHFLSFASPVPLTMHPFYFPYFDRFYILIP